MRDDSQSWAPPPDHSQPLHGAGVTVTRILPVRQTLISAPDILTRQPAALGWPDVATGDRYSLCLRRDRVLEINGPERAAGWHDGQAISDITDGLIVFEIAGAAALALIQRGTEISERQPSRSVQRLGFGTELMLYRWEDRLRLHAPRADGPALWHRLKAHLDLMG
ncbi:hypothetical protein [Pseudodonghicola flavimaris]|uniref:Sarcosine oxidase subunit gamma n=1 Tax=Pseudodonghicola flavimaris TaxID=3050036 RepID=A0ABT7F341_9RHOB|nr:hypothetical protein [Pseudodonghicola flavimaris]MDK3019013.1 hypothetical protein [Pseudodonghicola flavimaris]